MVAREAVRSLAEKRGRGAGSPSHVQRNVAAIGRPRGDSEVNLKDFWFSRTACIQDGLGNATQRDLRTASRHGAEAGAEDLDGFAGLRRVRESVGTCRACCGDIHGILGRGTDAIDEYYMLRNDVWAEANPEIDGKLCISCVERRIGRTLTAADFTSGKINTSTTLRRSPRLIDRLGSSSNSG